MTAAAENILKLTSNELVRLHELQRACPLLEAQLISRGESYLFIGYIPEREDALIRVENDSLTQGLRQYRASYEKLIASGMLRSPDSCLLTPDSSGASA